MSKTIVDISDLSAQERLHLIEDLWESLSPTESSVPLTGAQREELDRRLDDLELEGPVGIPWHEVVGKIRRQHG